MSWSCGGDKLRYDAVDDRDVRAEEGKAWGEQGKSKGLMAAVAWWSSYARKSS